MFALFADELRTMATAQAFAVLAIIVVGLTIWNAFSVHLPPRRR